MGEKTNGAPTVPYFRMSHVLTTGDPPFKKLIDRGVVEKRDDCGCRVG